MKLPRQIWLLAIGRFLSEIGSGFTMFYAPIFFVQQVGLSSTLVGIAIGSASISGILGRIIGGSCVDIPSWGRKKVLLLAALISAIAAVIFVFTNNFITLVMGNLCLGLGVGLYWPATESLIADLTTGEERREAYAFTRLADNLGLGIGIVCGGLLISNTAGYRTLFIIDSISFIIYFLVVLFYIVEPSKSPNQKPQPIKGWLIALGDRRFLLYILVNIIFTTYNAQIQTTLPLYFTKFLNYSPSMISALFTWYLIASVLNQIPALKLLKNFSHPQALVISSLIWAIGFSLVWVAGNYQIFAISGAVFALFILSLATVTYIPTASSLVADLAPTELRGVYTSINSLCWAIGYAIGPPLGGFSLDQTPLIAHSFWLILAVSVLIMIFLLKLLDYNK